jgi:hypothetical protein
MAASFFMRATLPVLGCQEFSYENKKTRKGLRHAGFRRF